MFFFFFKTINKSSISLTRRSTKNIWKSQYNPSVSPTEPTTLDKPLIPLPYKAHKKTKNEIVPNIFLWPQFSTDLHQTLLSNFPLFAFLTDWKTCARTHRLIQNTPCELLCIGSIKHARVDEKWADDCGLHTICSSCQELQGHGLSKPHCSELASTVVYKHTGQKAWEALSTCVNGVCLSEGSVNGGIW